MRRATVGFIFITLLLDVLGFGLLIPVAPKLVQQLAGGTEVNAAGPVGWLAATYALTQFLFAPTLGALSDRFGRRPVLLVSLLGSGLDYFAMALAPNLAVLFLTRAVNGLSGASMTVVSAYVADSTTPDKRAAGFGMLGAAFGLGFVLGPLAGGLLGGIDIRLPFYAAGALSLVNAAYGLFVLPESLPPERRTHLSFGKMSPIRVFRGLGHYPIVVGLAAALFLLSMAQYGLHSTWVLYTSSRYHWGPMDVGWSLFAVGVMSAVVQGGLAGRITKLIGEVPAVIGGTALAVLAFVGYGAATHGWMIYVVVVLGSFGGVAQPATQSIITRTVGPKEQGAIQGGLTALQNVANIGGPLLATYVFKLANAPTGPVQVPGASFFVGAVLSLLGLAAAAWTLSRYKPAPIPASPST